VKSPSKLQAKLQQLAKSNASLSIATVHYPEHWSELDLHEIAWMVKDYVNGNDDVIECDPLKDWLEEYTFFRADRGRVSRTLKDG
jgi:hypothetical protein